MISGPEGSPVAVDPGPATGDTKRPWMDRTVGDLLASARWIAEQTVSCNCADDAHQNAMHDLAHDLPLVLEGGGGVAQKSETHRVSPAPTGDAGSRERLDPLATTARRLAAISRWVDDNQGARDSEAVRWGRLAKVSEECGEVIAAYIGATGQNARKGTTHTEWDVVEELLDVALTALGAVEHMSGNQGDSLALFNEKVARVAERAGLS